jgi:hypothetical protein
MGEVEGWHMRMAINNSIVQREKERRGGCADSRVHSSREDNLGSTHRLVRIGKEDLLQAIVPLPQLHIHGQTVQS